MIFPKRAFPILLTISLFLFLFIQSPYAAYSTASADRMVPGISESIVSSQVDNDVQKASTAIQIRLQQAVFDPLQGPPALPPALTTSTAATGFDYYFVQFNGPILAEWRADLERQGAEIMDYVPDFAYIVRMDERALMQVTALEPVRWIGLYQPTFRLHNDLIGNLDQAQPGLATELVVRLFPGEAADVLTRQVNELGATVLSHAADKNGGDIFTLLVPEMAIAQLAHISAVAWIEPVLEPTLFNSVARSNTIMGQDTIETVLGLYGQNQIVAVGDTGLSTGNPATVHADFAGRVIGGTWGGGICGTWADDHSHGTHVAGSVLGSGFRSGADIPNQDYAGSHAGIAPEADLYVWSFCNGFSGLPASPYANYYGVMYAVDSQLRINTNSWGYTGSFGQYNTFTRETDRFVWNHQDMVLTYAAGNAGRDANSNGVVDLGSVVAPSTGKNVITVGASENLRMSGGLNPGGLCSTWGNCWPSNFPTNPINSDRISDNIEGMAAFSGRGPTLSNRIKPDVVAPGTNIVSARNESVGTGWGIYDAFYLYMGGTSMATPLVAGASAIVREFYEVTYSLNPSAALVKATLINGAYDMTPGQYGGGATQEITRRPDNVQGWGRVDLPNSLIYTGNRQFWFHEHAGLNTSDSYQMTFNVLNSGPFRATLVWTDYYGTEASHGALVNDLDLTVEAPDGTLYLGNEVLVGGPDRTNNVEGVDLMPVSGTYTVTVSGFNVPQGPQPFALVVTADVVDVVSGEWIGADDTDWHNTANWSDGNIPTCATNATIPDSLTNYPTITADATVANLVLQSGAELNMSDYTLTLCGNLDVQGTANFNMSGGTLLFGGTSNAMVNLPASNKQLHHVQIGNGTDPKQVTLNSDVEIAGNLTISDQVALYSNGQEIRFNGAVQTVDIAGAGTPQTVYSNDFSVLTGWTVNDANGDGVIWFGTAATNAPNSPNTGQHARYSWNTNGTTAADDWLFSPGFTLQAGQTYTVIFNYGARSATHPERLAVYMGNDNNIGAMTTQLFDNDNIINTTWTQGSGVFVAPASGTYHVGFHAYSPADRWELAVDNLLVQYTPAILFDDWVIEDGASVSLSSNMKVIIDNTLLVDNGGVLNLAGTTLAVNGSVTNNGTLQDILDTPDATTTHFLHIQNTNGTITQYRGVEITPSGNMGNTTVAIRGNQDCTTDNTSAAVQRCFDIDPTTNQSATIRFYYDIGEANGNAENSVSVYHWNGTAWDLEMGTYTRSNGADPHWVQVTDVSDYSPFVLDNQIPTAVSLANIGVNTAVSPSIILILLLTLVGTAVGLLASRRSTT